MKPDLKRQNYMDVPVGGGDASYMFPAMVPGNVMQRYRKPIAAPIAAGVPYRQMAQAPSVEALSPLEALVNAYRMDARAP